MTKVATNISDERAKNLSAWWTQTISQQLYHLDHNHTYGTHSCCPSHAELASTLQISRNVRR